MIKKKLTQVITGIMVVGSILTVNPIAAHAEWRKDNTGWWYAQGNSYAKGWFEDKDGKWYYFNNNGYMVTDTNVAGYQIDNNGVWIQNTTNNINNVNSNNTTNITNNINNGIIINSDVSINNIAQNNYNNTSEQTKTDKGYDGKDGFKKLSDDKYVYYENGKLLKNTWKKFDEGYRHFDEDGYLSIGTDVDGLSVNAKGLFPFKKDSHDYFASEKGIFMSIQPYYSATMEISGDINYITHTYDVFNIKYKIEYQDVYDSSKNGQLLNVYDKYGDENHKHFSELEDDNFIATKIISVGKYTERVKLS